MKKLEVIKNVITREYIYIYQNQVTFLDVFNGTINKDDCCGTIKTTINSSNNYYVIEVDNNERK